MMLDGVMIAWYIATIPSVAFVAIDVWRNTPEPVAMKWAFIILTLFLGPIAAFFYVLGCREPLRDTHADYVKARWRQALGSTMHCAAGDGLGIIVGAAIGAVMSLAFWPSFGLEYILGFGFGWGFFQAFAMKDMAGGSYVRSLKMTFLPEFLSMNLLMAGMKLAMPLASHLSTPLMMEGDDPAHPAFWFMMSIALLVGFLFAYPMNWWLVAHHLKHGMITVAKRPVPMPAGMSMPGSPSAGQAHETPAATKAQKIWMTVLSVTILIVALVIVRTVGG